MSEAIGLTAIGLTATALEQARNLDLTVERVTEMLGKSAPFRAPGLNRRFEDYGFRVGTTAVHEIVRLKDGRALSLLDETADLLEELVTWLRFDMNPDDETLVRAERVATLLRGPD